MSRTRAALAFASLATSLLLADCKTGGDTSALRDAQPTAPAAGNDNIPPPNGGDPAGTDNPTYAQRCLAELGLPADKLSDMSCLGGTHVNIKFGNKVVTSANWNDFVAQERKCDNPQWLTDECHPFDFVQEHDVGDVHILLNCRQKYFPDQDMGDTSLKAGMSKWERFLAFSDAIASGDQAKIEKYRRFAFLFNDMGVILKNKKNGKVCYFTTYGSDFFGGFIPNPLRAAPPDDATFKATIRAGVTQGINAAPGLTAEQKAKITALADSPYLQVQDYKTTSNSFYNPPNETGNCGSCHVYGGFNWSPFMRTSGVLPNLLQESRAPHIPVGSDLADEVRGSGAIEVKVGDDDTCTSCHRLVSQGGAGSRACNHFDEAVGRWSDDLKAVYSTYAQGYPTRAWMPLGHGIDNEAEFNGTYKAGIDAANCCCQHPTAKGCGWRRYGPTTAEVDQNWRSGKAPASIEAGFGLGDDTTMDCSLAAQTAAPASGAAVTPGAPNGGAPAAPNGADPSAAGSAPAGSPGSAPAAPSHP